MIKRYLGSSLIPRDTRGGRAMDAGFTLTGDGLMPVHSNIKEKGFPKKPDDLACSWRVSYTQNWSKCTYLLYFLLKISGLTFVKVL